MYHLKEFFCTVKSCLLLAEVGAYKIPICENPRQEYPQNIQYSIEIFADKFRLNFCQLLSVKSSVLPHRTVTLQMQEGHSFYCSASRWFISSSFHGSCKVPTYTNMIGFPDYIRKIKFSF